MTHPSRRDFLGMLGASTMLPLLGVDSVLGAAKAPAPARSLRIRAITAGVGLKAPTDLTRIEATIALLERARKVFEADDYEVQTLRVATPPIMAGLNDRAREVALAQLQALDELAVARDVRIGIGPVLAADHVDPNLPAWAAELVRTTRNLNFTVVVASPEGGPAPRAATVAAQTMVAIARATPGGLGNFRFAAAANIPPGTPFFPAAYHQGPDALAIGLESASLVEEAFGEKADAAEATIRLRRRLEEALAPVERTAAAIARREGRAYLGIDPSPAPGLDRSIGAAIEALTQVPFGSASTLDACAAVTGALKGLRVRTCGYAGLMLPVLEDPVLAKRATEGRYGVQDLLLYSSVCGTGLDVVPIPGDTPVDVVARIVLDVAALSAKLHKPLTARLFLIPGKNAGEVVRFTDPYLTDSAVLAVR
jgi:uncharacterized protein (UPF0210 family)